MNLTHGLDSGYHGSPSESLEPFNEQREFSDEDNNQSGGPSTPRPLTPPPSLVSPGLQEPDEAQLALRLGAIDRSTFDEFVSADNVAIMGQLQDEDYVADVVPTTSQSDSNKEIDDGPLPTSSEVISAFALVRRYCVNMEGCGLSCSISLDNMEACVLSQAAWSLKQKKIQDYFVPK
ncbi:hypothetical protein HPB50_029449 [Hyalomma asiaticum]|nr:hypothetical protein HPB50_029449 [Hyalomma asiaticum]